MIYHLYSKEKPSLCLERAEGREKERKKEERPWFLFVKHEDENCLCFPYPLITSSATRKHFLKGESN